MRKMIDDIKIVETGDGFQIEIKGDKEAIRKMLDGFLAGFPNDFYFGFDPEYWSKCMDWCGFGQREDVQDSKA